MTATIEYFTEKEVKGTDKFAEYRRYMSLIGAKLKTLASDVAPAKFMRSQGKYFNYASLAVKDVSGMKTINNLHARIESLSNKFRSRQELDQSDEIELHTLRDALVPELNGKHAAFILKEHGYKRQRDKIDQTFQVLFGALNHIRK